MTIRHAIWKVGAQPTALPATGLPSEQLLEDMIVAAPQILSEEWMLIGRQENTRHGGRIDLLAIAPDGALVLIEIKRDRTPRDVVAQAIDYASWVEKLRPDEISGIYGRFKPGRSLEDDFRQRFGGAGLTEDSLNESHQIVIVAGSLDDSTERIVAYLNEREIPINVLCFQVFQNGAEQLLSRAWLLDPAQTQSNTVNPPHQPTEPWNGEFYVSFGEVGERSWAEAVKYGFICAGGGVWYTRTFTLLSPGDRIWVKIPGSGFVGVGRVLGPPQPASEFKIMTEAGEKLALDVLTGGQYHRSFVDDPERCEHFVPVKWLQTVPREQGVTGVGLFGNQNTVCRPATPVWRHTIERLKERFPAWDSQS